MRGLSVLVDSFLLPPGLIGLAFVAALVLFLLGRKKAGTVVAAAAIALLFALSMPAVSDLLLAPLEGAYPPLAFDEAAPFAGREEGGVAGRVVVLGGGSIDRSPEEGMEASLGADAMKRLVYGLRIAAAAALPLVFTGGNSHPMEGMESEADAARRLVGQSGWDVECAYEGKSRTTMENARNVARDFGPGRVILVTSAYHMRRGVLAFKEQGFEVMAAPTDYKRDGRPLAALDFLPSALAFGHSCKALHEYLGLMEYSLLY